MAIQSNVLKPGSFEHHLVNRKRKVDKGKRGMLSSLMLTPMVDMFSLLVIFLLQAFSNSPELLVVMKGVTLPSASTAKELKDAPVLSISDQGVFLDQKLVGSLEEVLKDPNPLLKKLGDLRKLWAKTNPAGEFPGELTLQAHKEVSSTAISKLMAILPSAHYGSIQLAVVSGGA